LPTDWADVFFRLSDRFGWTTEEIGELTFFQLNAYLQHIGKQPLKWVQMMEAK